jgi:hypothetical protein
MLELNVGKKYFTSLFFFHSVDPYNILRQIKAKLKERNETEFTVEGKKYNVHQMYRFEIVLRDWQKELELFVEEMNQKIKTEEEEQIRIANENFDNLEKVSMKIGADKFSKLNCLSGFAIEDSLKWRLAKLGYGLVEIKTENTIDFENIEEDSGENKFKLSNGKEYLIKFEDYIATKNDMVISLVDIKLEEVKEIN